MLHICYHIINSLDFMIESRSFSRLSFSSHFQSLEGGTFPGYDTNNVTNHEKRFRPKFKSKSMRKSVSGETFATKRRFPPLI